MTTKSLVFTEDFDKAKEEIESGGGRIIHRLGPSSIVVSHPDQADFDGYETVTSQQPDSVNESEEMMIAAWNSIEADRGSDSSLESSSDHEGLPWDDPSFLGLGQCVAEEELEPSHTIETKPSPLAPPPPPASPSNDTLTGSVAVGIVLVSGNSWHPVFPFATLVQVSAGSDGAVWGVDSSGNVYRYRGGRLWRQITGLQLTQVSVGSSNHIWGVDSSGNVYQYVTGKWQQITGLQLTQVSVGSDGMVLGVDSSSNVYRYTGNNSWELVDEQLMAQVSVGNDSAVWGVDLGGNVCHFEVDSWHITEQHLKQVTVGNARTIWGVDSSGNVYQYNGDEWDQVTGQLLAQASVGSDGTVWGVDSNGNVYQYQNDSWRKIAGNTLTQVSVGSDGTV